MNFLNNNQLKSVISHFNIAIDELNSNSSVICLRSNFRDAKDAHYFMDLFSTATKTSWIVYLTLKSPQRLEFRKKWKCRYSRPSAGKVGCEAFIDIIIRKVNRFNKKKDKFLQRDPPLPGIIKIAFNHCHGVNSYEDEKPKEKDKVKQEFYDYFSSGVLKQEASHLHEAILLARGNTKPMLEDAAINPPSNMVNHMFMTWRYQHPKSTTDTFIKIEENKKHYGERGASVFYTKEDPFAVLIATATMKRAQELISAMNSIFVDTICLDSCGGISFTIMFTETKVGAVPIAILIHQDQTKDSYKTAFNLLKQHFPSCFGKEKAPKTFITDDNDAKKSALLKVWPLSHQILCHFYIAIAQWNYLWSNISTMQERPILMELFCNVMYANNQVELEDSVNKLLSRELEHPEFIQHFKALLERKHEWVLFDKSEVKSSNRSSHAEMTIKILKDVILTHAKNFTIVTLVEFCILVLDEYLVQHLSNFTYKESGKAKLLYRSLLKKANHELEYQSLNFNDNFLVQSDSKPSVFYLVNVSIGVCSCAVGNVGAFCKHQCTLLEEGQFKLPKPPVITQADEYDLSLLALGDKCPLSYFLPTKDKILNDDLIKIESLYSDTSETSSDFQPEHVISSECIEECTNEVARVLHLLGGTVPESSVKRLTDVLRKVQTESDATAALQTITLALSAKIRTKTSKTQQRYRLSHHQINF